jgi:hypothetical protein
VSRSCATATARCLDGHVKRPEDVVAEAREVDRLIAAEANLPYPALYLPPLIVLPPLQPCTGASL